MEESSRFHPSPGKIPNHAGIIPDGGRRWASVHGCSLRESYLRTRSQLQSMVELLSGKGVKEISLYLSSIQNFRREEDEMAAGLELVESSLAHEIPELAGRRGLRVTVAGNREIIPASLLEKVNTIEQSTCDHKKGRLNLLLAYDPLDEIMQAMNKPGSSGRFWDHLSVTTPVDLIIRTGDAPLLSNFLPLQSGYARLFFFERLFNDLTPEDILGVLEQFSTIERKFGN
ncbi:MAG: undecaprenyl diphosphate synthase family protein [bacterium]